MELLFHFNAWMTASGIDVALDPFDVVFEMFGEL